MSEPDCFCPPQKYYVSFSVPKLFQNSFKGNTSNLSRMSEVREYYLLGGIVFDLSDKIKFKPTFMTKAAVGSPFQFDLSTNFLLAERFWIGGNISVRRCSRGRSPMDY